MLKAMVEAFIQYQKDGGFATDWDAMKDWADRFDVGNWKRDMIGRIPSVGLATIQNLRMCCGVDTVKPDVHIKNALEELGLGNDVNVVELLSELSGYSCIELDQIFWNWSKKRRESHSL